MDLCLRTASSSRLARRQISPTLWLTRWSICNSSIRYSYVIESLPELSHSVLSSVAGYVICWGWPSLPFAFQGDNLLKNFCNLKRQPYKGSFAPMEKQGENCFDTRCLVMTNLSQIYGQPVAFNRWRLGCKCCYVGEYCFYMKFTGDTVCKYTSKICDPRLGSSLEYKNYHYVQWIMHKTSTVA